MGKPGVLDGVGVESHAGLLEHASRCTVAQRRQPDDLGEPRYYRPTQQGYEATIAGRIAARQEARDAARAGGGPRRQQVPAPAVDGMKAGGRIMRTREESRARLAQTEKRDANA